MAVDLEELIPSLEAAINPPGVDLLNGANRADLTMRLSNAFWELRLLKVFASFTEADGVVSPTSGGQDLTRSQQQAIVLYAAISALEKIVLNMDTVFRAQAGPTEFERRKGATQMRFVMEQLNERFKLILSELTGIGTVIDEVIDMVAQRSAAIESQLTSFYV